MVELDAAKVGADIEFAATFVTVPDEEVSVSVTAPIPSRSLLTSLPQFLHL